ncbi:MAG: hypothetical protein E6J06_04555 [Chloroflexi bacterium]|nr:MAG: hypothetical protein E6J06_04555 [Chloroflexota bacterium]
MSEVAARKDRCFSCRSFFCRSIVSTKFRTVTPPTAPAQPSSASPTSWTTRSPWRGLNWAIKTVKMAATAATGADTRQFR